MAATLLELDNLSKKYGSIKAVDRLTTSFERGNIYGLLGPNGSGKSTTLGMVLNVVNPTSGSFKWYEGTLTTHEALKKIGAIIERPNFYPYMTALQNLKLVCKIKKCSEDSIEEQLRVVDLWKRRNSKFKTYSLGMKQRLAIAAALVNRPDLLILDEPTNGLDPKGIHEIRDLIAKVGKSGTTVLLASHLLDEVEKICSHVIVLQNGVNRYSGRVDELSFDLGYFELSSNDDEALRSLLQKNEAIGTIENEGPQLKASLIKPLSAESLSKSISENGIILTHFVKRKPSLETRFLDLTQNQNA